MPSAARCEVGTPAAVSYWAVSASTFVAPGARALDSGELPPPTFAWGAGANPLNATTLAAVAAGVSTRRYASTLDPLPPKVRRSCASKSAVSRRFKELSQQQLDAWLNRRLDAMDLPVILIDAIHFADRVVLIALGIDDHAGKHILGIREGSSEAARVVTALLSDLIERGLDAQRPRLWVIDGGKALRRAITQTFGAAALIQRCQEHKRRNVLDHLPKTLHASVNRALREAYAASDADLARHQLQRLASSLTSKHPGAAAGLREGLEDTLTLQTLGITGSLYRTVRTTNPIENLNGLVATYTRNVKRWSDGAMVLRWVASALNDAAPRMRARLRPDEDLAASPRATLTKGHRRTHSSSRVASPPWSRHLSTVQQRTRHGRHHLAGW